MGEIPKTLKDFSGLVALDHWWWVRLGKDEESILFKPEIASIEFKPPNWLGSGLVFLDEEKSREKKSLESHIPFKSTKQTRLYSKVSLGLHKAKCLASLNMSLSL